MSISERFHLALSKRAKSKREVARQSGLSSALLSGDLGNPRVDTISGLASALDVPPEWLAFGAGKEPKWGHRA